MVKDLHSAKRNIQMSCFIHSAVQNPNVLNSLLIVHYRPNIAADNELSQIYRYIVVPVYILTDMQIKMQKNMLEVI